MRFRFIKLELVPLAGLLLILGEGISHLLRGRYAGQLSLPGSRCRKGESSLAHAKKAVFRIWDVYPGSRIRIFSFADPNFFHPGSRIRIKELKYFNPKIVSKHSDIWSGLFIPDPDPDFLPIPDPKPRGQRDTGSGIRIRNTVKKTLLIWNGLENSFDSFKTLVWFDKLLVGTGQIWEKLVFSFLPGNFVSNLSNLSDVHWSIT